MITQTQEQKYYSSLVIDTPLGAMLAIADEKQLYLLEFVDSKGLEREIERLKKNTKSVIVSGKSKPIVSIELELQQYFNGEIKEFKTPLGMIGSDFQKNVWQELKKIPYGQTRSYADMAAAIKNPKAIRAAATANGANQLALIIPCHRVINSSGELGGYAGGLARKEWLLNHEKQNA